MATTTTTTNALAQVVVLNNGAGITVVPTGTPLTSLNYFDQIPFQRVDQMVANVLGVGHLPFGS